jgi:hypothetical protein
MRRSREIAMTVITVSVENILMSAKLVNKISVLIASIHVRNARDISVTTVE